MTGSPESETLRVLVVDDSEDFAGLLADSLEDQGYAVSIAHDGDMALEMVEREQPHCVLFDVGMPNMDGNQLSRRLRERHGDDIVLIAISGYPDTDRAVEAAYARADHYLRKPFDLEVLHRILKPGS